MESLIHVMRCVEPLVRQFDDMIELSKQVYCHRNFDVDILLTTKDPEVFMDQLRMHLGGVQIINYLYQFDEFEDDEQIMNFFQQIIAKSPAVSHGIKTFLGMWCIRKCQSHMMNMALYLYMVKHNT